MGFKDRNRFKLGIIVGSQYSGFLSLDEYVNHFLMPFSPRLRNIDFTVASLAHLQVTHVIVFTERDKEIILDYLVKGWPYIHFMVFDRIDIHHEFENFFQDFCRENHIDRNDLIAMAQGDYPVWVGLSDMRKELDKMNHGVLHVESASRSVYPIMVMNREAFRKRINTAINAGELDFTVEKWYRGTSLPAIDIPNGYIFYPHSLKYYYDIHIRMLKDYLEYDDYYCSVPVQDAAKGTVSANLMKHSHVINSIVGENVEINGRVENSVIFSNVKIDRGANIVNSLILPGNHIGNNVTIVNAIIDEFSGDNALPNIERNVVIGSSKPAKDNRDFPKVLNFGVSLIGKDVFIPPNTQIGGNCYVESFVPSSQIRNRKSLPDGESILA